MQHDGINSLGPILVGSYHFPTVVLSLMVALLGSYAAFELAAHAATRGTARHSWLVGGGTALAIGIWSTHYTGMLAFRLPVPMRYHWPTTLLSLVPALVASLVCLFVVINRVAMGSLRLWISGVVQGAGISVLHYTAMASMQMRATHHYSLPIVALSVALAMAISLVSLWLMFRLRDERIGRNVRRSAAALAMGVAIAVMHYTGMAAAGFRPSAAPPDFSRSVEISSLGALGIGAVSLIVLVAASLSSVVDRMRQQRALLNDLFEQSPDPVALLTVDLRVVRVNREFTRVFGYGAAETVGRPLRDLVVPDDAQQDVQRYVDMVRQGQRVETEAVRRRKDGTRLHVSMVHVPISVPGEQIAVYSSYRDITERNRAAEQLRHSHQQLRALAGRLESLREDERTRISRELHDELGQTLTALSMDLVWVKWKLGEMGSSPSTAPILERLAGATELVDAMIAAVRQIAGDLRPSVLDNFGLFVAMQYECRRFHERSGIRCEVLLPETQPPLSPELATAVFRILQECLTNVARHADASTVVAELNVEGDGLTMRVQDDGEGVTEEALGSPKSLGLLGMRERAALLGGEIDFRRGGECGTIVTLRIPRSPSTV
jgi:PAS domain S-box-containing protein